EGVLVTLVLAGRDLQPTIEKTAAYLRRHGTGHSRIALRHFPRTVIKHALKDAERGIENDLVFLQELNKRLHLFRFWVDLRAVGCNLSKASGRARVFYLRHEVQKDEIHVLDLVHAVANKL